MLIAQQKMRVSKVKETKQFFNINFDFMECLVVICLLAWFYEEALTN